jgi:hypothetical protein
LKSETNLGLGNKNMHAMKCNLSNYSNNFLLLIRCYAFTWQVLNFSKNLGVTKPFSHGLKRVCWPMNFKLSRIEKYEGSNNPAEWHEVYQLSIKATGGGDSYVMANYLPICLSSSARTWLMGLPTGSVRSWSDMCRQFISNFRAMCVRLGVD